MGFVELVTLLQQHGQAAQPDHGHAAAHQHRQQHQQAHDQAKTDGLMPAKRRLADFSGHRRRAGFRFQGCVGGRHPDSIDDLVELSVTCRVPVHSVLR
jgi:hypothetical protein